MPTWSAAGSWPPRPGGQQCAAGSGPAEARWPVAIGRGKRERPRHQRPISRARSRPRTRSTKTNVLNFAPAGMSSPDSTACSTSRAAAVLRSRRRRHGSSRRFPGEWAETAGWPTRLLRAAIGPGRRLGQHRLVELPAGGSGGTTARAAARAGRPVPAGLRSGRSRAPCVRFDGLSATSGPARYGRVRPCSWLGAHGLARRAITASPGTARAAVGAKRYDILVQRVRRRLAETRRATTCRPCSSGPRQHVGHEGDPQVRETGHVPSAGP